MYLSAPPTLKRSYAASTTSSIAPRTSRRTAPSEPSISRPPTAATTCAPKKATSLPEPPNKTACRKSANSDQREDNGKSTPQKRYTRHEVAAPRAVGPSGRTESGVSQQEISSSPRL